MANRDSDKAAANTLLDASAGFCQELSERLTAAGNYASALWKLADPAYRSAAPHLVEILEKAMRQLEAVRQLVHQYRQVLTDAAEEREQAREEALDRISQALTQTAIANLCENQIVEASLEDGNAGSDYRVCFINRVARGDAAARACRRSIVVCSAKSGDRAIEIARKRFAESYGINDRQIGFGIITVELLDA